MVERGWVTCNTFVGLCWPSFMADLQTVLVLGLVGSFPKRVTPVFNEQTQCQQPGYQF